jgi:hypothetical protein
VAAEDALASTRFDRRDREGHLILVEAPAES